MSLNGDHFRVALRSLGAGDSMVLTPDQLAVAFNEAMTQHTPGQFDTVEKVAALLSSAAMESNYFRTTEEYAKDGPYRPYIGRTFMQLTWQNNYARFGAWCFGRGLVLDPNVFALDPPKLAGLDWADLGAVWYFTQVLFDGHPLTYFAADVWKVARAVNMGNPYSTATPGGIEARIRAYDAFMALGSDIVPTVETTSVPPPEPTPTPTPPPPAEESKETIMAAGTAIKCWNNDDYTLAVGEQAARIKKGTKDNSVVIGTSTGVDVVGVVEVKNPSNYVLHGYWAVFDVENSTNKAIMKDRGIAVAAVGSGTQTVSATFKGDVPKPSKSGRNHRLRFVLRVGKGSGPLPTVNNIHVDGWKL